MKSFRIALSLLLLTASAALAQTATQKSFDQLKALAGSWEGTYDGKPMQGAPIMAKPDAPAAPALSPEEAQSTFKSMVADGSIPHGKFVDSVAAQTRPLSPKQLAVVLDIIAKAQAKRG